MSVPVLTSPAPPRNEIESTTCVAPWIWRYDSETNPPTLPARFVVIWLSANRTTASVALVTTPGTRSEKRTSTSWSTPQRSHVPARTKRMPRTRLPAQLVFVGLAMKFGASV